MILRRDTYVIPRATLEQVLSFIQGSMGHLSVDLTHELGLDLIIPNQPEDVVEALLNLVHDVTSTLNTLGENGAAVLRTLEDEITLQEVCTCQHQR